MTEHRRNRWGQPIGVALPDWCERPLPAARVLEGRSCVVRPLALERDVEKLFHVFSGDGLEALWTYLPYGPFATRMEYRTTLERVARETDARFFTIADRQTDIALGLASYLRIAPEVGSIEVGHLCYAPELQRTTAATEAMYLMMQYVFAELGYRRYEWKCDALNAPSRRAAERLGFRFEGIFRQAQVYKGRNRDTAWYSILDSEWPALERAFERWLAAENFDSNGKQRQSLQDCAGA